jgi:hypothetical protein
MNACSGGISRAVVQILKGNRSLIRDIPEKRMQMGGDDL